MKYNPYPKYKDSGVEWLGEIPEEWNTLRIGFFYSRTKETDRADMQLLSVYRDYGVIPKDSRDDNHNNASEDLSTYQVVREGDLVINKMKAWQGSLGISVHEGIVSPAYFVLRPVTEYTKSYQKQFFHYLLRSQIYFAEYEKRSKGIRINQWDLPYEEFKTISVLLPNVATQRAIAAFLDAETARIDGLIKDYEDLIELLKEKRQTLISHAVTRGLSELVSPDDTEFGEWAKPVRFKDSGVEWIGEIPEGWDIRKMKYLCDISTGSKDTVDACEDGIFPFFVRSQTIERIDTFSQDCEGILTAGDGAGVGKVFHHYTGKFDFHQRVYLMYNFRDIYPRFFFHYLNVLFSKVALDGGAKSTVDSLRRPVFSEFFLTVTSIYEQKAIANFVDRKSNSIDMLIRETESAIELLKEHRSALITNAVTGKINVEAHVAVQTRGKT